MAFEKEFISGEELRKYWDKDPDQFFKIILFCSMNIPGNGKWLLRPHNPRNYKEVFFADGSYWPPCREDHGIIKDNYMPPEHETGLERVREFLDQYQYRLTDKKVLEDNFPELLSAEQTEDKPQATANGYTPELTTDNCFRRNDEFWQIHFKGADIGPIRHVDGLLYIAQCLAAPGIKIPDQDFFKVTGDSVSVSAAIQDGLYADQRPQEISTPEALKQYRVKYLKLQQDFEKAESELERNEIEREMSELSKCLRNRNFTNPDDKKCQANVSRRIKTALDKLPHELAQYLRDAVRTDNYGRVYTGNERWAVEIK